MRLNFYGYIAFCILAVTGWPLVLAEAQPLAAQEAADRSQGDDGDFFLDLARYCRYFPTSSYCSTPVFGDDGAPLLFLVFFDPEDSSIRPGEEPALRKALTAGKLEPAAHFSITGHAEEKGDRDMELDLSVRRAAAVAAWLGEKGLEQERISLSGAGATHPLVGPPDGESDSLNRRVEILVDIY